MSLDAVPGERGREWTEKRPEDRALRPSSMKSMGRRGRTEKKSEEEPPTRWQEWREAECPGNGDRGGRRPTVGMRREPATGFHHVETAGAPRGRGHASSWLVDSSENGVSRTGGSEYKLLKRERGKLEVSPFGALFALGQARTPWTWIPGQGRASLEPGGPREDHPAGEVHLQTMPGVLIMDDA